MNKYQKETIKMSLEEEKKVLNSLTSEYKEAKKAVKAKLKNLMEREDADLPHVIHQIKYQKAIESQLDEALEKLKSGEYKTISDYMEDSYGEGFTSSLYRLQKQGVPLLFPMDKNEIIRAVQTNSKISGGLYKRLGINTRAMKNAIRQEITRGISSSMSYGDIARNLDNRMNSGLYNSYRIARTEGHRINQEASYDAMNKAKEAGADVVKQWDSTLDGRTRPHHRDLNGQIRELDEPFEVAGLYAMYPSGFGKASEDINCRCVVLEIGRWELDEEDTYTKFNGDEGVIVKDLSNVKNYEEFRKKYNIEVKKKEEEIKLEKFKKNYDNELAKFIGKDYYDELHDSVVNCSNQDLSTIWKKYEDDFSIVPNRGGAYFSNLDDKIHISKSELAEEFDKDYLPDGSVRMLKARANNQVMFHEAGHNLDYILGGKNAMSYLSTQYKNGAFPELITIEINDRIDKIADEIKSVFKSKKDDMDWLYEHGVIEDYYYNKYKDSGLPDYIKSRLRYSKEYAYKTFRKEIRKMGVDYYADLSDIIEGVTYGKVSCGYGHGTKYWKDRTILGVNYGLAKEAFAEMVDSTFSNPKQLEAIKKYLPKSYKMFEDMINEAVEGLK